jgi:hypothetical protein
MDSLLADWLSAIAEPCVHRPHGTHLLSITPAAAVAVSKEMSVSCKDAIEKSSKQHFISSIIASTMYL